MPLLILVPSGAVCLVRGESKTPTVPIIRTSKGIDDDRESRAEAVISGVQIRDLEFFVSPALAHAVMHVSGPFRYVD